MNVPYVEEELAWLHAHACSDFFVLNLKFTGTQLLKQLYYYGSGDSIFPSNNTALAATEPVI